MEARNPIRVILLILQRRTNEGQGNPPITRMLGRRLRQEFAPPGSFSNSTRKFFNCLSFRFKSDFLLVVFGLLIVTMAPFILNHLISNDPPMLTSASLPLPNNSAALQTNFSIYHLHDDNIIRKVGGIGQDYTHAEQIILETEYRLQSCLKRNEEYVQTVLQFEEEISRLRENYSDLLLKERNTRQRLVLAVKRFRDEHLCIPMRTVYVFVILSIVLVAIVSIFRVGFKLNGLVF
ncbi:hypothetical protein Ocin01_09120 [Orchesella cincta]|uniref:Transmembrane protein n=1 Tax=Orchesella cincta TaxID=48709 RepID=A0A1D2MX56_ORCCI|nr:hypothetical protein Ocin01_09120 [Orchesella cincta]